MKILFLSYGIIEYDGRLIELYNVSKKIGDVTLLCCGSITKSTNSEKIFNIQKRKYLGISMYTSFIIKALVTAFRMKKIDILFVDNYFTSIIALILKRIGKVDFIIQDVRELYFIENMRSWRGRLFFRSEAKLMSIADVVLCANKYRAEIMQNHYKLLKKPIVFENIRFLKGNYNKKELDIKYKDEFIYDFNIVCTGGVSPIRKTDVLVNSMNNFANNFGLYIVGGGSNQDKSIIKEIIRECGMSNVKLIDKVPMNELKYILSRCDIGIVHYNSNDINNKYCASGKIYEYLAEGLPIVTTENIPLKDFCEKTGVGIADDSFYHGINEIAKHMDMYKCRVKNYISEISVDKYNMNIANEIKERI